MLFAIDIFENKIHIDSAKRNQEYFCPCCHSKLVLKLGDERIHHFAHIKESFCKDSWHYDMSLWHYNWQNKFPIDCQEIIKSYNGETHRADVLIEKEKIVFEFQHSNLSPEEFESRNKFYNNLGYKVLWIFDVEEAYSNDQIENYRGNLWSWKRPRKTFDYFNCKNNGVEIYLQLEPDYLVKATWCTDDNGFSRFATNGYGYYEESILNMFRDNYKHIKPEKRLSELYDSLIQLYSKDHTTYFFGCPISKTHICANCNIDVPKSKYNEIMPCMDCQFEIKTADYENPICNKRFLDLNLNLDTIVCIESRDKNSFINKISFIEDNTRKYIELTTFDQNISKSIFDLWDEKFSVATFRNVRTGKYIRITKNPKEQYNKYHKVYGYFSSNKYEFSGSSCELYGLDKNEWICEWFK